MGVIGDTLYLSVFDYHEGSQLWKSSDGEKWEVIFREPDPNFFQEGGGPLNFKGHFLWFSNDLKNGLEIWRTDEVMVAEATTTTLTSDTTEDTTVTSSGGGKATVTAGGGTSSGDDSEGDSKDEGGADSGGLSGGSWL